MKKFFALLLTLAMTVSLVACTSDSETQQDDTTADTTQRIPGLLNHGDAKRNKDRDPQNWRQH